MTSSRFRNVLFDWGGTLMSEEGPLEIAMGLWPEVRAIDGAHETLAALATSHRLGIATNATVSKRDMIERALARVSLLPFITDIFCFTEMGVRKDSPEFWSRVVSNLGVPAERIAMVGDTLEQDVIAPRNAGVYAVWFNDCGRRAVQPPGIPVITRLPDLVPLVRP
jgi:FMN phosphatase YigB (HAD superfamily)